MTDIAKNLEDVRHRIAEACTVAHRDFHGVTLVAVSKTQPIEAIRTAYDAGQRHFAENYAQELRDKARRLPDDIIWHFIGHLQKNKVRYVVGTAALIHSVDSVEILEAIAARAAREKLVQDILIELNLAGEATKTGAPPESLDELATRVRALPAVRLRGLMTMAPYEAHEKEARAIFGRLNELGASLSLEEVPHAELSMGMSGDFESAIAEGATLVRIGTAIFGPRRT